MHDCNENSNAVPQGHVRTFMVLTDVKGKNCRPSQIGFEIDSWMLDKDRLPSVIEVMDMRENDTFCA